MLSVDRHGGFMFDDILLARTLVLKRLELQTGHVRLFLEALPLLLSELAVRTAKSVLRRGAGPR